MIICRFVLYLAVIFNLFLLILAIKIYLRTAGDMFVSNLKYLLPLS